MTRKRERSGAVVFNGKIYVFGGENFPCLNSLEVFDLLENKWSAVLVRWSELSLFFRKILVSRTLCDSK